MGWGGGVTDFGAAAVSQEVAWVGKTEEQLKEEVGGARGGQSSWSDGRRDGFLVASTTHLSWPLPPRPLTPVCCG